jgi:hypothetical protein
MTSHRGVISVLVALVIISLLGTLHGSGFTGTQASHVLWNGFLFGIPLALGVLLFARVRWALMAAVMYGTIGLALDISTVVQELTKAGGQSRVLMLSGLTGLLNFLLIAIGGRGFLDVLQPASPPTGRAPNPRSPSSKE